MTKSLILLIVFLGLISPAFSQNDQLEDKQIKFNSPTIINKSNNSFNDLILRKPNLTYFSPELYVTANNLELQNSHSFDTNSFFKHREISSYTEYNYLLQPEIVRNQPLMHDFNKSQVNGIFGRLSLYSNGRRSTFIGIGEYFQISSAFRWTPSNRFSMDIGGFFCRQFDYFSASRSDIRGVNNQLSYYLTDKLQLNIWGQYVFPSEQNIFYGNTLFPNSNIGGSLSYKGKKPIKLEVGTKYQYYESKKNWNAESGGKISVGF
jgi:hypothetical protein